MRLIDADALKSNLGLSNNCKTCKIGATKNCQLETFNVYGICTMLDDAPTVEPKMGWISVKDRLPKSMVNQVLVWLKHDDLVGYVAFGHYEKYKGQEIWFDLVHSEAFSVRGYTVTHWMPLPEPPKPEGGETDGD